jgi:predicted transcriptional regulator
MKQKSRTLTEQELEIMKVVWGLGEATVRQVYEALREQRKVAYTTVMTMMNILENKGHLEKQAVGRAYLYEPTRPRQQVISGLVEEFLDRVFDGSARHLLLSLVKDRKVSSRDLDEIIESEP